jgi:hypothetical protein
LPADLDQGFQFGGVSIGCGEQLVIAGVEVVREFIPLRGLSRTLMPAVLKIEGSSG